MYTGNNIEMYLNGVKERGSEFSRLNSDRWQAVVKLISLEFVQEANNFVSNLAAQKSQLVIWSVGRHSLEKLMRKRQDNI